MPVATESLSLGSASTWRRIKAQKTSRHKPGLTAGDMLLEIRVCLCDTYVYDRAISPVSPVITRPDALCAPAARRRLSLATTSDGKLKRYSSYCDMIARSSNPLRPLIARANPGPRISWAVIIQHWPAGPPRRASSTPKRLDRAGPRLRAR